MNQHVNIHLIEVVAAEIREILGEDYDDETLIDTIDGETSAIDVVDGILASMQDDDALVAAIKDQETKLATRRKRIEDRKPAKKKALLRILDAMGVKKLERPLATVSRRSGSVSTQITDETDLPTQLYTEKVTRTPDKAAIKRALDAGENVPGAALVRGDDTVTVRTI